MERNCIDMICPQIYRYDFEKYQKELEAILQELVPSDKHDIIFPGILLKVGDYIAEEELLPQKMEENRRQGIQGEVFFFTRVLKDRQLFSKNATNKNRGV